jgi:membrane-associated phospholipid phosphatase
MRHAALRTTAAGLLAAIALVHGARVQALGDAGSSMAQDNPVLEWNQIFIETLIATNTANSSSPRLGAIVQAAVFDAYNGIDQRYTPLFVEGRPPEGASREAAVVAAAYTALAGLFPSRQAFLEPSYAASLESLLKHCLTGGTPNRRAHVCETRIKDGVEWGTYVAHTILDLRANDGFSMSYPAFVGGTAVGQWRPTPPAFGPMSAQALAFTDMFVLANHTQFQPEPPRPLGSTVFTDDFNAVKTFGRLTGSRRTDDQTALAPFWEGNASVHWNQAANQMAQDRHLSMSRSARLFATLNIAMADTVMTIFTAKRFYGSLATEVTWRPLTAITLAESDGNPDTVPDPDWLPLITTPSHPEYPAGHPSLNGAAATILLRHFHDRQTFTLTTAAQPSRTYSSISRARADGNHARVWGGMHYPSTVAISDATGAAIAEYVDRNAMRRLDGR